MKENSTNLQVQSGNDSHNWIVHKLSEILNYEQPGNYIVKDTNYQTQGETPVLTAGKTFILGYTNEKQGICKDLPVIIFDDFTTAIRYIDFPFKVKSSAIKLLRPTSGNFDLRFVFEKLQTQKYLIGSHKRHYISEYQNIEIDIPPLPEQIAIAEVLSDVDALIDAQEALIEKKRLIKQGVMQELLTGKRRLPGFSGEWKTIQIKDIFDLKRGLVLATSKIMDSPIGDYKYPVYSSQTQSNGLLGFYNEFLFEDCITWTTDGANAGDVNFRSGKFYCTNVCGVCINNPNYSNKCIAGIINRVSRNYVSYVGNPKLMNNVFAEITVKIPLSMDEQNEISDVINDFEKEEFLLETQLEKIKSIKIGMMQELLTGRTRLV